MQSLTQTGAFLVNNTAVQHAPIFLLQKLKEKDTSSNYQNYSMIFSQCQYFLRTLIAILQSTKGFSHMKRFYKIPNELFDIKLSSSAFVIYLLLINRFYFCSSLRIKLATLSKQSHMSVNTVRTALAELQGKGLITVNRRYRHGRITTNEYSICRLPGGFSKINSGLFFYILKTSGKSALMTYAAINRCASGGRAFPSHNQISSLTGLSRSTCINKVTALGKLGLLGRQHYICNAGDFGNNNYFTIGLRLRLFLFNILLAAHRKARASGARLLRLLKAENALKASPRSTDTKNTTHPAPILHAGGGIIFDKHITDSPKYENIENNKLICSIKAMYRNISGFTAKAFGKVKSAVLKLQSGIKS